MTRPRWQGWTSTLFYDTFWFFPRIVSLLLSLIRIKKKEKKISYLRVWKDFTVLVTFRFPCSVQNLFQTSCMHYAPADDWLLTHRCSLHYLFCIINVIYILFRINQGGKKKREKKRKSVSRSIPTGEAKERNEFRNETKKATCSQVQLGKGGGGGEGRRLGLLVSCFFYYENLRILYVLNEIWVLIFQLAVPVWIYSTTARAIFHHSFYNYNTCSSRVTPGAVLPTSKRALKTRNKSAR